MYYNLHSVTDSVQLFIKKDNLLSSHSERLTSAAMLSHDNANSVSYYKFDLSISLNSFHFESPSCYTSVVAHVFLFNKSSAGTTAHFQPQQPLFYLNYYTSYSPWSLRVSF